MTSAEKAARIFARVFSSLTRRHADMITFRRLADLGKPVAVSTLHQEQLELANAILMNPSYAQFFPDPQAAVEFFGGPAKMAAMTTSQEIQKYSRIIDAASLVFLHSALDAAVSDLCRVTLLLDPASWEPYVLSTKVTLDDAITVGIAGLTTQKLETHIDALDKESMLKRIDRLFAVCKPDKDFTPIGGEFAFDLQRICKLDEQRHRIVHGEGYQDRESLLNDDLEFLVKTGLFLWSMVNMRFDVILNPLYAMGIELPTALK
jgi:hypothetical protein